MDEPRDPDFVEDDFLFSEHPNPQWARKDWMSLDGTWKVERDGKVQAVRVPFPVGSEESGADFPDSGLFVYSRSFELPAAAAGRSCLLRIGACDYETTVLVNGREAGRHVGGYASFALDITSLVGVGANELVFRVRDSHSPYQVRGKQTFLRKPFMVWYGGVSGPWQSVWLEFTGPLYVERASAVVDFDADALRIEAFVSGSGRPAAEPLGLALEIGEESGRRFQFEARFEDGVFRCSVPLGTLGFRPWSPENPILYRLRYILQSGRAESDAVESYFGVRRIRAQGGRVVLNGEPVFLRMALVQGYYPGGVYTPKGHGRERDDILALKRMDFNGARIHQKIESPYFLYLCDRLGLLVTFEMPSFYLPSRTGFRAYESELREILRRDAGHPSGIAWVLFNETWGVWGLYGRRSPTRRFVRDMVDLVRREDPTRLVIDNSGWEHLDTDVADVHHYLNTAARARRAYDGFREKEAQLLRGASGWRAFLFYLLNKIGTDTRPVFLDVESEEAASERGAPWILSEYGGFGWYRSGEGGSVADKIETYTRDAVDSGLFGGYCLTQLYDVGAETNGLLSFGREPKVPEDRMRTINGG